MPQGPYGTPSSAQGGPQGGPYATPQGMPPGTPPGVPPTVPPTMPTVPQTPPPPGPPQRPSWLVPTLAAALVVLVAAGGVGAYLVYGKVSGTFTPSPSASSSSSSSSRPVPAAAQAPDVCAMLPKEEADRLVPAATVQQTSRNSEYTVNFGCSWVNRRISFGEYWRNREIEVKIAQHRGDGAKTGRAMAQNSFEIDQGSGKYAATAKPSLEPDEKEYISPVKSVPGVGEGAFAQYTWRRDKVLWYSFGRAMARVNDFTIEVRYQASQQRKDAQILSADTVQSITEENAIREVSGLIGHFAKGVAAWQAKNPNVLAKADATPATSTPVQPSATPTPSPTVLAAFPPECQAVTAKATELVPAATTRARGLELGEDNQTECRWLNLDLPAEGADMKKIRSMLITVHRFTNRAGAADESAAKSYYASERGGDKSMAESKMGGIGWGKLADIEGLGDQAYQQFVETRSSDVAAGTGTVLMRRGPVVIRIDYAGHQRPKDAALNSPRAVLMAEKEGLAGARAMAEAFMAELTKQPVGS